MTKINIGGVPEHFNLPWHMAIQEEAFLKAGIEIVWQDFPGGTGAMCAALRSGVLDLAVLLTEGIVADITNGNPAKIIKWYVETPLVWGIHVSGKSPIEIPQELQGLRYAISRVGSGSHLMACVDATSRGWQVNASELVVVGDIQGAIKTLQSDRAEIFLWEKFMTKPYVDQGILKRVGEVPTPWPCFALAANPDILLRHPKEIKGLLQIVNGFHASMQMPGVTAKISELYNIQQQDAATWLQQTRWSTSNVVSTEVLELVVQTLQQAGIVKTTVKPMEVVNAIALIE